MRTQFQSRGAGQLLVPGCLFSPTFVLNEADSRGLGAQSQVAGGWGWGGSGTRSVNTWTGSLSKMERFPRITVASNLFARQFKSGGCWVQDCVCLCVCHQNAPRSIPGLLVFSGG